MFLNTNVNSNTEKDSRIDTTSVYNYKLNAFFENYKCKYKDVYFCKTKLYL